MTQRKKSADGFAKRMKAIVRDVREKKRKRTPAKKRVDAVPRSPAATRARDLDVIVLRIAEAMCANTWSSGVLSAELAAEQGVSSGTVENWAGQAARMLRVSPKVDERARLNLARLDEAHARAADTKEAVAAIAEQNKMLGLHAPTVVKVEASVQAMAKLSTREQLVKAKELLAALPETVRLLERKLAEENAIEVPALPEGESSC